MTNRPAAVILTASALALLAHLLLAGGSAPLVYSLDPRDPWNVIHGLLLAEPEGRQRPRPLAGWPGDDAPEFFFDQDPKPLKSGSGHQELVQALGEEARKPHGRDRTIEARLLFQQDLWRIFDETFDQESGAPEELRAPLGRLLSRLAPTAAELARLRPNWAEIATYHPGLEPGLFEGAGGWRELRAVFRSAVGTSTHAGTAGHRRVFRAFAWLPSGAQIGDLGSPADKDLPHGSRVVLVETIVALSNTGELKPVPLVVRVELRGIPTRGRPDQAVRLVLHASRLALSGVERVGGGVRPIDDDALVRSTLGCYPFGGRLEPLRTACLRCHGPTGRMLQTGSVGGPDHVSGLELLDSRITREREAVLRRKAASREYRALLAFFQAARGKDRPAPGPL